MNEAAAAPTLRATSWIDLWKSAALALILVDHLGFFIFTDQPWMLAVGRAALPIFFFLIGFSRNAHVPWFWWAAGIGLTAFDVWRKGGIDGVTLSIMINFALIRLSLPLIERHGMSSWWRFALVLLAFAALSPFAGRVIEYGATGWLLALVGRAHKIAQESGPDGARAPAWLMRRAAGALATLVYIAIEFRDYRFGVIETWVLVIGVILVSGLLLRFVSGPARWQPQGAVANLLAFCGRHSLEIYLAQIVGLGMLGLALDIDAIDINAGDDEEEDDT